MISKAIILRLAKFGFIGVIGFAVDSAVLLCGTNIFGLDLYSARIISYVVAATTTWLGNRLLTFADRPKTSLVKQWATFLALNGVGFLANYTVYAVLVAQFPYIYEHPVWAVAVGSLAGMMFNYVASTRFIFPN
jgi:putative flippase GtrA